jgi:hypothetical protein
MRVHARLRIARDVVDFVRAVLRRVTLRKVLMAQVAATALNTLRFIEFWGPQMPASFPLSGFVITTLDAQCVLLALLCADEAVRRGARRALAYPLALMTATLCASVAQWYIRAWLGLFTVVNKPGVPSVVQKTQMLAVATEVIVFGALVMLVYLKRQRAMQTLERARLAELSRAQTERRLIEARLTAAQAYIDPQVLFDRLAQVGELYVLGSPAADVSLESLIQVLRAARRPAGRRRSDSSRSEPVT